MRMLASAPVKGWSDRYLNLLKIGELKRRSQASLRRRQRAREAAQVRREIDAVELTCVELGCRPEFHDRTWSMNDEYQAPSDAVWRALAENDEGLRFVDFDGAYRTETR